MTAREHYTTFRRNTKSGALSTPHFSSSELFLLFLPTGTFSLGFFRFAAGSRRLAFGAFFLDLALLDHFDFGGGDRRLNRDDFFLHRYDPVSYTHLTLPTIYSV